MPTADRLKRRILREAVRHNVDAMYGRPPRVLRPSRQLRRAALQAVLLAVVPSLGFVLFGAVSGSAPDPAQVPAAALFPAPRPLAPVTAALAVHRIVLDPGHGGGDSGARAAQGLWEKEITLDVARRLARLLREATYEVVMTRDFDAFLPLRARAETANRERADVFVSIHVNSVQSQACHAVETYYVGPADDPRAEQLAGVENRDSGFHLADFRRLLEGVYVHVRQAESRKLAEAVQRELVTALGTTNPAIRDKGVRSAPFLVLVASEAPGILAEVSCLSNDEEAARLADPTHRERIARALFLGIHGYAEERNRTAALGHAPGSQ